MIVTTKETFSIHLELSKKEAEILRDLVQNSQGEPDDIQAFKKELFNKLKESIV